MNKCLVTKLNGSSNNPELLRLGEMHVKILKVQNPTSETQGFSLMANKPVTLEIVSDGYFTDETLTENKGKVIVLDAKINQIFVNGNNDVEIAILNKYILNYIASFANINSNEKYGKNKELNISDLKYSTALIYLNFANTKVSGNIGELKALTNMENLELANTKVSGNIGELKTLTSLTNLNLSNTKVSGNIGELKTLTSLTKLYLYNPDVPLTGNISELSTLSNCSEMGFQYSKLTGDLATLPASCRFVLLNNSRGSELTWSTRPSSAKIIAMQGNARLDNIDKMLQDQAQCQVGFSSKDSPQYKTISISGNRTSASDEAVATLQQKGYTISIAKV